MLGAASPAWEKLLGYIRYHYVMDEKWAEGKPTHKHYYNSMNSSASKIEATSMHPAVATKSKAISPTMWMGAGISIGYSFVAVIAYTVVFGLLSVKFFKFE